MSDDAKIDALMKELMEALPGYVPIENPNTVPALEKFSLAKCFADKGFRNYLNRCLTVNINGFASCEGLRALYIQQGRVSLLKELLRVSEQMFKEADKIDKAVSKG